MTDNFEDFLPGDCEVEGCQLIGGGACPEQYDVYYNQEFIGYLRLRHGNFRADLPNGKTVYRAQPKGDGIFDDDERQAYLYMAVLVLLSEYRDKNVVVQ